MPSTTSRPNITSFGECSGIVVEHRGPGFDHHWRHHVVSLSKTHYLPRVLIKAQEVMTLLRHD